MLQPASTWELQVVGNKIATMQHSSGAALATPELYNRLYGEKNALFA